MPKRGQTQPWKVVFQYDGQQKHKRACTSKPSAEVQGQDIANRGAIVELYYRDPASGREEHVHTFVAEDPDGGEEW